VLPKFIKSAGDLVTSHQSVRDGFLLQALAKTRKAEPYIAQAHRLWDSLNSVSSIDEVVKLRAIHTDLLAAAGFSDKARNHLGSDELTDALSRVVVQIAKEHGGKWREEILYRFLLTKGDSLGGSMRNYTGAVAGIQLSKALLSALADKKVTPSVRNSDANPDKIQAILWPRRILLFDRKPAFSANNIDAILLDASKCYSEKEGLSRQQCYLACGELKGGIDPAGADEHWKTANTALNRIRTAFVDHPLKLFFVGAAIEASMAAEIFSQLNDGRLTFAANLTVPNQVTDLAAWISGL